MYNEQIILFSNPILQGFKKSQTEQELREKLINYSEINNYENIQVIYFYIIAALRTGQYFEIDREIIINLFFEAAYWASAKETRQKLRPKCISDIKIKKKQHLFIQLSKELMVAITRKYFNLPKDPDNIKYNVEVSNYLDILYEISCIKRDRVYNSNNS